MAGHGGTGWSGGRPGIARGERRRVRGGRLFGGNAWVDDGGGQENAGRVAASSIPSFSPRHKRSEQPEGDSGKNRGAGVIGRFLRSRRGDSRLLDDRQVCFPTSIRGYYVVRERFSYKAIHNVLSGVLELDLHAKRVNSLCDATLGVLHSGSLAICTIDQGLAAARSLKPKHAIKQVDRLLSNSAINVDDILVRWVPFVIGARDTILVAMDWTLRRSKALQDAD